MIRKEDFLAAWGEPDEGFDRALDGALRQIRAKEARPVMKKKLSVGLIAALIAVLTLTGAALAVGLNLFGIFGRWDERLAGLAPQSELEAETPGEVETEKTGRSVVEIVNAWYDGEYLIVAYTDDNARTFEPFTPTAEELARMEKAEGFYEGVEPYELGGMDPVEQAFIDAKRAGKPCGFVEYSVFASDQLFAGEDGEIELLPSMGSETTLEDGRRAYLMEFSEGLPAAARNRDELTLRLPILRHESRWWFDGKDTYLLSGPLDAEGRTYEWIDGETHTDYASGPVQIGEAVATVKRSTAETRRFTGEGSCNGVPVHVEAAASAVRAEVRLTSQGAALADPCIVHEHPDGGAEIELRYDFTLTDETGAILRWDGQWVGGDRLSESAAQLDFEGVGRLPGWLSFCIDDQERGTLARITLTPEE